MSKLGRPKGTPNKSTDAARYAIAQLVNRNTPKMMEWLEEIAKEDPLKAFDCMTKVMEYHIPKLARQEITGQDGGSLQVIIKKYDINSEKPVSEESK